MVTSTGISTGKAYTGKTVKSRSVTQQTIGAQFTLSLAEPGVARLDAGRGVFYSRHWIAPLITRSERSSELGTVPTGAVPSSPGCAVIDVAKVEIVEQVLPLLDGSTERYRRSCCAGSVS